MTRSIDDQITKMVDGIQILMNGINSQSEQIGVISHAVRDLKSDVGDMRSKMGDMDGRLEHLEDDQFVDLIKADNIRLSAQRKVAELLDIEFEDRGGVTEESMHDYKKYFGKFVGRLHVDARHAGLEGPRIYATPRKNYKALLDFIEQWSPARGVKGQKAYYDKLESARNRKHANQ